MPSPNGLLSLTVTATEQGGSGSKSMIVALMTPMLPATSLALHPSQTFGVTQQFRTSAMSTYPGGDIPLISMSAKDPFNNNSCQSLHVSDAELGLRSTRTARTDHFSKVFRKPARETRSARSLMRRPRRDLVTASCRICPRHPDRNDFSALKVMH